VTRSCSERSSVARASCRDPLWRLDRAGAAESEATGRAEKELRLSTRLAEMEGRDMSNYHKELGGELSGVTVFTTSDRCQVEELETVGGRSVRYLVDHQLGCDNVSSARAEYWNGERGEWVRLEDLPVFSAAGSGTCRCWVEEVEWDEDAREEIPMTFGAQTALAEMRARAYALLAPLARDAR